MTYFYHIPTDIDLERALLYANSVERFIVLTSL